MVRSNLYKRAPNAWQPVSISQATIFLNTNNIAFIEQGNTIRVPALLLLKNSMTSLSQLTQTPALLLLKNSVTSLSQNLTNSNTPRNFGTHSHSIQSKRGIVFQGTLAL